MKLLWLPQIVFDSDGGGGSKGGGSNDGGSSKSTPAPAPKAAAPAPAPKPAATPTFKNLTQAAKAGYHGKAVKIEGKKGLQKVAFKGDYDTTMAKASAAANASKPSSSRVTVTSTPKRTSTGYDVPGTGVDTSFADAILSGAKKDVLAPTLTKAASKASEPNFFERAAAAKMFKDDYGVDVSKPITSRPLSRTPSNTFGLTQSNDSMSKPYEAPGIASLAQKSPGYLGVQGTPQNDYEKFLERYNSQSIAAAVDPYGMSTATGVAITPAAQKMLDDAGMTPGEYQKAVMDLGKSLDDPRFGDGMIGKMLDATMVGKGLDYLADMPKRRAYEQLTGQYEATPLGKLAGYGGADVARVVPMFDKQGNIIGSLEVNAQGEAVSYTGDRSADAVPADSTVTGWEDKVAPRPPADVVGGGDDEPAATTEEVVEVDPECPDGYVYDKDKKQCVIDPFQQPFQDAPAGGGLGATTAATLSPYTAALPTNLSALNPSYVAQASPIALSAVQPQMPMQRPGLAGLMVPPIASV